MSNKTFYVTTPLYYVNAEPHIGHAYTTILADVMARYRKLEGCNTFFLTGTDEHGSKIDEAAQKKKLTPMEYVNTIVPKFKAAWEELNIKYDYFIRTTDKNHCEVVQKVLNQLHENGDIYEASYSGQYCVPCERFWTEGDLVDGNCPDCGRKTKTLEEKNYFFKMSKYQDDLIDHIKRHPKFIYPESRKNEILGFLDKKLNDLCISRPKERLSWGIPLPFDEKYVTYVWFDALLNYISGVGYLQDDKKFSSIWPADYQLIGKDILTTHAVYWCTMLMAIGLELPKTILAHGWWLTGSDKMSKSKGNVIDPMNLAKEHGADIFRYYVMKDMTLGQDSSFTEEVFKKVINSDLANDLGNLISRTSKMTLNYFNGSVPEPNEYTQKEEDIKKHAEAAIQQAQTKLHEDRPNMALESVMEFVRSINKYIVEEEPWTVAKDPDKKGRLQTILYTCLESLRIACAFLQPVMPNKCEEALQILGSTDENKSSLKWGALSVGSKVLETKGLFPRIK